ncbi:ABC transporter substrate-binding protein [Acetobacter vaccinii]|uniref:ABC transporter substrate-binding protein n=1 Tax=Acetobacter vaccinii TaxID=2592655 RepID=A0A5C1YPZ2_9PROT|nr:ABC transporter substrate-binding protein [Acetobacter vaccinii]QEO17625.1 ABC transporter substrate-binding protein [Acetobacter vaccinii]
MVSKLKNFLLTCCLVAAGGVAQAHAAPLQVGYSDWPGWVAWQVAIDKHWFKDAGVDVSFQWFDYSASLDAYASGKLDGILATNGDVLVTGANGRKGVMVLVGDYSDGNDMIVAAPGITSVAELKGKKVGVERGLVEHLLLLVALQKAGLKEDDITLVDTRTNETPQVLASGEVAAIAAWQPNSGQALRQVPGARPVFTSAQVPGLIYDVLAVDPVSLKAHPDEWKRVVSVWKRVVAFVNDPKTQDEALEIMARKVGLKPVAYKKLLAGTHLLTLDDNTKVYEKNDTLQSIYGSTENANLFNVKYGVYKTPQNVDSYIDPAIIKALAH